MRHVVLALKTVSSPAGPVLDRFSGPGWTASPANMLEMLRSGGHVFQLAGCDLRLKAVQQGDGGWGIAVVGADNVPVPPATLPHWQLDQPRSSASPKLNWFQRLLDPNAR